MSRNAHEASSQSQNTKQVPFNQIFVDPIKNSRKKLKDVPKLAENVQEHGLLSAFVVSNGGDAKHPYTLEAGYRRHAALTLLDWGSRLVDVIVVSDGAAANVIENVVREPLPALDLAERLSDMQAGTYPTSKGTEPRKWTKAELAKLIARSGSHVANLIRVHESVTDEVKDMVRAFDPSARVLFAWAAMKAEKQKEAAEEWVKDQEALAASGQKRKTKGKGGKGDGDGDGGGGSSKPGKKVLTEKLAQLQWKSEARKGKEAEIALAAAKVLRFVLGDLTRFPPDVFSGEDSKEYAEATSEEEEEVEDEE